MRFKDYFKESIRLYRGNSIGGKGHYWSTDREWARQFTQSGRDEEIDSQSVNEKDILIKNPLPRATVDNDINLAISEAKQSGFKGFMVDEGKGQPNSVFMVNSKFNESKEFRVALNQLYSPSWKVQETLNDIGEGRPSKNNGIVKVSKMGSGKYFIIDGNHRVVEAIQRGEDSINVVLDEFIPDMTRTAGAYNNMIGEAVQVVNVVKKELEETPMYHGSSKKFDKPNLDKIYWLTPNEAFAKEYSQGSVVHRGGEPIVYQHDINVSHPAKTRSDYISILHLLNDWVIDRPNKDVDMKKLSEIKKAIIEEWHRVGLDNSETATHNHWNMSGDDGVKLLIYFLETLGYDSIYYNEQGNDTYGIWKGI